MLSWAARENSLAALLCVLAVVYRCPPSPGRFLPTLPQRTCLRGSDSAPLYDAASFVTVSTFDDLLMTVVSDGIRPRLEGHRPKGGAGGGVSVFRFCRARGASDALPESRSTRDVSRPTRLDAGSCLPRALLARQGQGEEEARDGQSRRGEHGRLEAVRVGEEAQERWSEAAEAQGEAHRDAGSEAHAMGQVFLPITTATPVVPMAAAPTRARRTMPG